MCVGGRSVYLSMDVWTDKHSAGVRPGDGNVLVPPPPHDNGHVEAEYERERNLFSGLLAILGYLLKQPTPNDIMYNSLCVVGTTLSAVLPGHGCWCWRTPRRSPAKGCWRTSWTTLSWSHWCKNPIRMTTVSGCCMFHSTLIYPETTCTKMTQQVS